MKSQRAPGWPEDPSGISGDAASGSRAALTSPEGPEPGTPAIVPCTTRRTGLSECWEFRVLGRSLGNFLASGFLNIGRSETAAALSKVVAFLSSLNTRHLPDWTRGPTQLREGLGLSPHHCSLADDAGGSRQQGSTRVLASGGATSPRAPAIPAGPGRVQPLCELPPAPPQRHRPGQRSRRAWGSSCPCLPLG